MGPIDAVKTSDELTIPRIVVEITVAKDNRNSDMPTKIRFLLAPSSRHRIGNGRATVIRASRKIVPERHKPIVAKPNLIYLSAHSIDGCAVDKNPIPGCPVS